MIAPFAFDLPVRVEFGRPAAEAVGEALGESRALLMTLDGAAGDAIVASFAAALGERLIHVQRCADGLATLARARELCARLWPRLAQDTDAVLIGVGGGTVMDLAKLVRCRPRDGGFERVAAALRGSGGWDDAHIHRPWLVPTTAGTGSEVTRWATIWDTDQRPCLKRSLDEPFAHAERAFVDPALALSCPPTVVRDTALDALGHALESIWNRHASPIATSLALVAAQRIVPALPAALRRPDDPRLRGELALASLEAGIASSQTRTALAHALSYELTLEQGLAHGHAVAIWLPRVWQLAIGRSPMVDDWLGRVFGGTAADGAARLETWLRALGVEPVPEAHGVSDSEHRIGSALGSARGRNFIAAAA